ncbi:MAG: GlsB/YeaQ/YmgE family stress response membrane protein [Acidimicrobiia bacterium]
MLELIIWALLAGIIIGPLARLMIPGQQNISIVMTILLGAIGALVGGIVYRALGGTDTPGIDWLLLVIEVAVAAVAVVIYISARGRRTA